MLGVEPTTELHPAEVAPLVAQLNWSADATSVEVVAITSTEGAYVRYTTNGSQPYPAAWPWPPVVTCPLTVKAVGFRPDLTASETLTIIIEQLPSPTIEVTGGRLRITSIVPDTAIEYALDAGDWTAYTEEITVPPHGVVRARVTKPGLLTSPVSELHF